MKGLSVEIAATDVNILDRKFPPFLHIRPSRTMSGCVLIEGKIDKYTQTYEVYSDNVQIIVLTEIYKVPVRICFAFEGRITPPPGVIFVRTVTERTPSPLFNVELDNCRYGAQLQVEEKEGLLFFRNFVFISNLCRKHFSRQ
jgi:hypothetical protein